MGKVWRIWKPFDPDGTHLGGPLIRCAACDAAVENTGHKLTQHRVVCTRQRCDTCGGRVQGGILHRLPTCVEQLKLDRSELAACCEGALEQLQLDGIAHGDAGLAIKSALHWHRTGERKKGGDL